jgi:hypothetical protein
MKLIQRIKHNPFQAILVLMVPVIVFFALIAPWLFTTFSSPIIFNEDTGHIGNTFGIMSPFIAIAAVIVTYLAFRMQLDANEKMFENSRRMQFERQFYEMLKIHCDNVMHLHLDNMFNAITGISNYISINGQDFIRSLLDEFNRIYAFVKENIEHTDNNKVFLVSYYIFYFGQNAAYKNGRIDYKTYSSFQSMTTIYPWFAKFAQGHLDQLSSYYRHLYLTVKTVAQADEDLVPYTDKRQFLRILRAQLSSAEQTLLFFNWLSGHGKEWEEDASKSNGNHFFTDYRMIHNIIPEQQPFTKESILQSILSRNPHYRTLNDEDTLFELIDEKEA